ncbi:toll/interleukin-1 receptor domain-containing protein [Streptomyces murinus]|uniref:toll/interleukin-1 receptor domain-containing protein n=1 Tax=Streptomyces murinus TaxID=33900 RepID=UPI003F47BE39
MQIFLSWSGEASKRCAEALRDWLPFMNQAIIPFVSSQDISKGERAMKAIATQLQECSFGIVCVTRDNQSAPWINFESGAISRELGESSLIPFLLDMPIKDLTGPITQFQATDSSSEEDVWAMIKTINDNCSNKIEQDRLRKTFEKFWEDLTARLSQIRTQQPQSGTPERGTSEILNELVALVREQSTRIGALEKRIASFEDIPRYTINEPREIRIVSGPQEVQRQGRVSRVTREQAEAKNRKTINRIELLLGAENIVTKRTDQYGVDVVCNRRGEERLALVTEELQKLAISTTTAINIRSENGAEIFSHPPF